MHSPNKKKSQRNMLLVLGAFILPILLAKLALNNHWFNYGVTNKGALVASELSLKDLGLNKTEYNHKWTLIYVEPNDCIAICVELVRGINNTYVALGEEIKRVVPIALTKQPLSPQQINQLSAKAWQQKLLSPQVRQVKQRRVFIADPLGKIVLEYNPPTTVDKLPSFGKAILADFKKLLKYSRVG